MRRQGVWWERLMPWLDAVRIRAGELCWTGLDSDEGSIDLDRAEGPIVIRSISGGAGALIRRTFAACPDYVLDITRGVLSGQPGLEWEIAAPVLRAVRPGALPERALPLESRWAVEWWRIASPHVRTSGEARLGMELETSRHELDHTAVWHIRMPGNRSIISACHEPSDRCLVQATTTLVQEGRYTVHVIGDGFSDYWMLDPEHTPRPLMLGNGPIEVGDGWGFVRFEGGRETAYGALRREWGTF